MKGGTRVGVNVLLGKMERWQRVGGLAQRHPGGGELMNSERLRGQTTRCLIWSPPQMGPSIPHHSSPRYTGSHQSGACATVFDGGEWCSCSADPVCARPRSLTKPTCAFTAVTENPLQQGFMTRRPPEWDSGGQEWLVTLQFNIHLLLSMS